MYSALKSAIEKFIRVTEAEWEMLAPYLTIRSLKKHENLAEQGKVSSDIGFVLEGNMRHYYTRDGEEKTTYFYFENHFVCSYISCITHQPSQLTIEALSDCKLIVFPYAKMAELMEQNMAWQKFGRLIAEYLCIGLEERMVGLLMLSPEDRYLQLLDSGKNKILERIPQHYLANYLGITPVSLSRIRNRVLKK